MVAGTDQSDTGGIVAAQNAGGLDRSNPDRPFGAWVFALGRACMKARDDVKGPAGLAVRIEITSYNVLAAVVIIWTATGSDLGCLLSWGAGVVHTVFGMLFLPVLAGMRR